MTEIFEINKRTFEGDAMSRSKIFEWHKWILESRETTSEYSRSGRLSTSKNDEMTLKVREIIGSDLQIKIRELPCDNIIS